MSNYEIMLILDPKADEQVVREIATATFASKQFELKKLERTELAYEIKKSKTALYYLVQVQASGFEINEFLRKANIAKAIWRILSINLDHERGLNRKAKIRRVRRPVRHHRSHHGSSAEPRDPNAPRPPRPERRSAAGERPPLRPRPERPGAKATAEAPAARPESPAAE